MQNLFMSSALDVHFFEFIFLKISQLKLYNQSIIKERTAAWCQDHIFIFNLPAF